MKTDDTTASVKIGHEELANAIRVLAMDAVQGAKSGHPGMPMGMADVATVLFSRFLKKPQRLCFVFETAKKI